MPVMSFLEVLSDLIVAIDSVVRMSPQQWVPSPSILFMKKLKFWYNLFEQNICTLAIRATSIIESDINT